MTSWLAALRTPAGAAALEAAEALADADPLVAASALRARGVAPTLAATALSQARLRRRATAKFGADAWRMFFTGPGLEQATRPVVADRRAARLREAGVRGVADLGCGIGSDTLAFARAGLRVRAVEADPEVAAVAAANLAALGLSATASVECCPAESADLSDVDAVFCDPARRSASGRRVFDPAGYSPPWSFVAGLPARVPATVLKLAPGVDHAILPPGAEAEWVSVNRELVETTVWCGPLARVRRRATVLAERPHPAASPAAPRDTVAPRDPAVTVAELVGTGERTAPVGPVRRYLYDPDPAVVRSHLIAEFADTVDGTLADPTIGYVFADRATRTPYARCLEVVEVLPFSVKRLRAALRSAGVGRVEILKRGSAVDPERLRRDLRLSGDAAATVVLTRVAGAQTALRCRPPVGPPAATASSQDARRR